METNKYLDAAIEYVKKYDWAVFPVDPKKKKPLTPNGCKDAKKDIGALRAWWKKYPDAAIGIATGSISKLIVIDEDRDFDKGLDGYESVKLWQDENGPLPDTVQSITGRGGYHLYYYYDGKDIKNRAGILEGVDVRGEGGYIIAPPSKHPNGTNYEWEYSPEDIELAKVDDTVHKFLQIGKTEENKTEFKLPAVIGQGQRNDTLYRLACSLQSQGFPDETIFDNVKDINAKICQPPLDAKELEIIVNSALRYKKGEFKIVSADVPEWHEPKIAMRVDKDGNITYKVMQTYENCEEAIAFDKNLHGRIRYNEIAYTTYVYGKLPWKIYKGWREWTNADDSYLLSYLEKQYGLTNNEKIMNALSNVSRRYPVNPIKGMLEDCQERWDGNKYVENLLPIMLGCEKNEYNTAVMKLFMLGAVARIYHPGCKFDYMIVLVGPQGKGKSTFLRYLALNDDWFNDNFSTLDNSKAVENLRGMWIVELAELQATKRAKDVEQIKSFITSRVDTIRAPYERRTEQRPRMCVLAGTSNPVNFLTDRTGNRRFLPIICNVNKPTIDMFSDEIATKAFFCQAWGEIMDEYKRSGGNVKLVLDNHLQDQAIKAQEQFTEEDAWVGIIQEWLDGKEKGERVCAMMIWREALGHLYDDLTAKDNNRIQMIMKNSVIGWKAVGQQRNGKYGRQTSYEKFEDTFIDAENYANTIFLS